MGRTRIVIAVLCTLFAAGCGERTVGRVDEEWTAEDRSPGGKVAERTPVDPRVAKLFGGPESVQNIAVPTKVRAFRIGQLDIGPTGPPKPFGGFPVTAGPVDVSQADRRQLADILLNADRYAWGIKSTCILEPGVAFRFTAKGSPTEVIYCFSCDDLSVYRDGKHVGIQLTFAVRGPLLAIVKRLFPKDAEIQKIEAEGHFP